MQPRNPFQLQLMSQSLLLLTWVLLSAVAPVALAQEGEEEESVDVRTAPEEAPEVLFESDSESEDEGGPPEGFAQVGGAVPDETAEPLATERPESTRVRAVYKDMDISEVFSRLRKDYGVRIEAKGAALGQKLSLRERDIPVEDLLTKIGNENKWVWVERDDGAYQIMDKDTYVRTVEAEQVIRQIFPLRYINAAEMVKVLEPMINAEIGSIAADERSNKIIVVELPHVINMIQAIVQEYDTQLYTRVFEIEHADTEGLADRLEEIKSDAAEMHIDPLNRLIIVTDTFEKIKIMEQLVELLDQDQEIRIYNLVNIGLDGEIAEEIVDTFIEPLISEDAILEWQGDTGKLVVRDVTSVHDKIYAILKELDTPRKQVLIEGEVMQITLDHDLSFGMEWQYSRDLNAAIAADQPALSGSFNDLTSDEGLPIINAAASGLNAIQLTGNVRAQLKAAMSDSRSRLLLRPRIIIVNHEIGTFDVTRNDPIINTFFSGGYGGGSQYGGGRSSSQSFVQSGLIIDITPHISNRGLVELEVSFENSQPIIVPAEEFSGGTQRGVGTSRQRSDTVLIIPDGETRVIGGLISDSETENNSGVPFLADIPFLGFLFGTQEKIDNRSNVVFFITPTIIEEQPKNDLMVVAVNAKAKASMGESELATGPDDVNEIPEELQMYLDTSHSPRDSGEPLNEDEPGSLPIEIDEPTTDTFNMDGQQLGRSLLTDEPYVGDGTATNEVRLGGALEQLDRNMIGPTGAFGADKRASIRPGSRDDSTTGTRRSRSASGRRRGRGDAGEAGRDADAGDSRRRSDRDQRGDLPEERTETEY